MLESCSLECQKVAKKLVVFMFYTEYNPCPIKRRRMSNTKNKEVLGVAIYYFTYSTWEGPVLYVEDLFVIPGARGRRALIQ